MFAAGAGADPAVPEDTGPPDRELLRKRMESVPARRALLTPPSLPPDERLLVDLAEQVDIDSLLRTVEDLVAFGTRFEYTAEQESAAEYLFRRFADLGYEPFFHEYDLSEWDLFGTEYHADQRRGWMAARHDGAGAMLRTDDGGATWNLEHQVPFALHDVGIAGESAVWAAGDDGFLLRYDGSVWEATDTLGTRKLLAVDFLDSLRGMVASRSGSVYRTNDGGATWIEDALGTSGLYDVVYVDSVNAWTGGTSRRIWHWNGSVWERQSHGSGTIYDLDFAGPSFGAAVLISGSRALVWDGTDWTEDSTGVPQGYAVEVEDDSTIWVAGRDDTTYLTLVHRTENRGADWIELDFPFGVLWRIVNRIVLGAPGQVFLSGYDGLLLESDDGGASWTFGSLPPEIVHRSRNVGAELPGTVDPEEAVILSAHYDSYSVISAETDAPGADDDASGVAAVLEAARVMSGTPSKRTIRFLLFSGEELGLRGSTAYAVEKATAGEEIAANVQIDMIGYSDGPLRLTANEPSFWILNETGDLPGLVSPYVDILFETAPEHVYSDHASFWASGYDAVLLSESFTIADHPLHTPGDTLGLFDENFFLGASRFAAMMTAQLAGAFHYAPWVDSIAALPPFPNPSGGEVTIRFAPPGAGGATARVYNTAGRMVREVEAPSFPIVDGAALFTWDGRSDDDRETSPGVYFIRIETDSGITKKKVVRLK